MSFTSGVIDRAADARSDPGTLARLWQHKRAEGIVLVDGAPVFRAPEGDTLLRIPTAHGLLEALRGESVFLGLDRGAPVFAVELMDAAPLADLGRPDDLRSRMAILSPQDAELAATARALLHWHRSHLHCGRCGARTEPGAGGWQRHCPDCGALHFPRTDPVVIVLVLHGNSVLLGRSHGWPEGMHSLLAGFVEPGETVEAAARRECFEEAGVTLRQVRYVASQPWAFPMSLMLGCVGRAGTRLLRRDPHELEAALWLSREELADAIATGRDDLRPPRRGSIARHMLEAWLAGRIE